MKFNKYIVAIAALIALAFSAGAQTNSFLPGLTSSVKEITVIPYAKYDVNAKDFGFGVAALYPVSSNFWAGARVDRINGQQTTAGVQGQIQDTITWHGLTVTPFLETSVGMGSSALYASAGPGFYTMIYSKTWSGGARFNLGLIADYEHVVNDNQNSNQLNIGPMGNLSF